MCNSSDTGNLDILLLFLIYKLYHKDACIYVYTYIYIKEPIYTGFGTISSFKYIMGILEHTLLGRERTAIF